MFVIKREECTTPVRFTEIISHLEKLILSVEDTKARIVDNASIKRYQIPAVELFEEAFEKLYTVDKKISRSDYVKVVDSAMEWVDLLNYDLNSDEDLDFAIRYFNVRAKILIANRLLKGLRRILPSLNSEELPEVVPRSVNFVKNNKMPSADDDDLERVRERFPVSIAEDLANTLDITDKEMATILTISIRTYHRLKLNGLLNPVASERLLLLKDLAAYGLEVFEDQNKFNKWLRLPLRDLKDNSPLTSLDTATGFALVKTILGRIDYGVYS